MAAGKIDPETVDQMRSWTHSGFSVDDSVYIVPGDPAGLQRLAEYILRCPFSLSRVVRLTDDGSVIYRAEKDHCRRFPGPASADLRSGPKRNFQVFSALDFLAEVTQHIPNKGEHLVRGHRPKVGRGWYSHRQRGIRDKLRQAGQTQRPTINRAASTPRSRALVPAPFPPGRCSSSASTKRIRWRVLVVAQMKISSFIKHSQRDVIERIFRHCGRWEGPLRTLASPRAPPVGSGRATNATGELELVPDADFLESERREQLGESTELQLLLDPDFL